MNQLVNKWQSLTTRERVLILVAAGFVLLFLLNALVVSPLNNAVNSAHKNWQKQAELASWLKPRVSALAHLSGTSTKPVQKIAPDQLFSTIDNALEKSDFSRSVSQISQSADGGVQVNLSKVSFDNVMGWLVTMWQTHQVQVTTFQVTKEQSPGIVNVTMTLDN